MANILNVISAISPFGGTITKLRVLMTQSTQHKHFLYHPGFKNNEQAIKEQMEWYKLHNIPAYYGIYGRNILRNTLAITRIIKENDIDIVHFYFNHEQTFAGMVGLMNPKVKLVRSIVGFDARLSWFRRMAVHISIPFIPNYIYISRYIKELYEKEYPSLKKKNTTIIYNGAVNVKADITPIKGRKKVVVTSELCKRKNLVVLIEAFNYIVNEYLRKDIQLYILGGGQLREELEILIKKYNLYNNVILVGRTPHVSEYLNDCAVYVHPATTEGFGIAVVEAMQMKCPCIVADKGALPELIMNGECGYVIDAYDSSLWAERIVHLYDNEEERIRMGENSYKRAIDKFSLGTFIKNHDLLYSRLSRK